jgi:hypothetical protein
MRLVIFTVVTAAALSSCTCDPRITCATTDQCPTGQTCSQGECFGTSDAGDGGDAGTNGGGQGGGAGGGSAGGLTPCTNLECRLANCAQTHTGCTVDACAAGAHTTISGVVYEPGAQLPLYNVTVYVPNAAVAPFTVRGTCETCGASVTGSPLAIALTDDQGRFTLTDVPSGANVPLVIQIGRWRRQVTIPSVTACANTALSDKNQTRLPRTKSEGDLPLMALASGKADPFECLLLKMGIAQSEFTTPGGGGRVHFYNENGLDISGAPAGATLSASAATLNPYDVVFLPCEGGENRKTQAQMTNVENYVNSGGRLFVTHFGYTWTAFAPPPFSNTAVWRPDADNSNKPPDPVSATVNQSFAKGQAFASWLQNVNAATNGVITLSESRNDVGVVNAGTTAWMKGDASGNTNGSTYNWTPHLTFTMPFNPPPKPDGSPGDTCGRVVFSDFHVTTAAVRPRVTTFPQACVGGAYTAQEKALVFMVFDLSSCVQDDMKPPTVCQAIGGACSSGADCCSGLVCQKPDLSTCTAGGAGCACQVPIQ